MEIERCVLYMTSVHPTRLGHIDPNGKMKVPITLPRVKCLDETEEEGEIKYRPYNEEFIAAKVVESVAIKEGAYASLTPRQQKAFDLHSANVSTKEIASQFRTSSSSVRNMISVAKVRLGIKKIPLNDPVVNPVNKDQEP